MNISLIHQDDLLGFFKYFYHHNYSLFFFLLFLEFLNSTWDIRTQPIKDPLYPNVPMTHSPSALCYFSVVYVVCDTLNQFLVLVLLLETRRVRVWNRFTVVRLECEMIELLVV